MVKEMTEKERDGFFRGRVIADYKRLIKDVEDGIEISGEKFIIFVTPMEGKLIAASLRAALADQEAKHKDVL